ncbi:hypothetical protein BpHYR1_039757, partial [Brachionus plicatilis]
MKFLLFSLANDQIIISLLLAKEETSSIKNEEPIEFKTSHLQSEEFGQTNFEPKTSMERLEKIKSQTVLSNPTIGKLHTETAETFKTDSVVNQNPEIKVQDQESSDKKYVTKIQCFNLPRESYTQGDEQAPIELNNNYNHMESRVSTENVSDYQKVAALNTESSENEEDKLEPIREIDNNLEMAQPTTIDQNMNQATILTLNKYARCREIIELYNTYKADDLDNQLDPDIQCVPMLQQNLTENQIKINETRHISFGLPGQDKFSECEEIGLDESDEIKPILSHEPNLITGYQKSKATAISLPMENNFSISSSSLDSLENEIPNESNSNVQYVKQLDTIDKIESLKPFNLNRFEKVESPIDQVEEFKEILNLENTFVKSEIDELNQKIDNQNITLINVPMEMIKSESEDELESISDGSLIEQQNLNIRKETKPFITAEKKSENIFNASKIQNVSLYDSQEADELSFDKESEHDAKYSFDETRIETYEIQNRFHSYNLAKTEQNSMQFEETDSFSLESMDENYLIPISKVNIVSSQP